jgi:hypothetical protein
MQLTNRKVLVTWDRKIREYIRNIFVEASWCQLVEILLNIIFEKFEENWEKAVPDSKF